MFTKLLSGSMERKDQPFESKSVGAFHRLFKAVPPVSIRCFSVQEITAMAEKEKEFGEEQKEGFVWAPSWAAADTLKDHSIATKIARRELNI